MELCSISVSFTVFIFTVLVKFCYVLCWIYYFVNNQKQNELKYIQISIIKMSICNVKITTI